MVTQDRHTGGPHVGESDYTGARRTQEATNARQDRHAGALFSGRAGVSESPGTAQDSRTRGGRGQQAGRGRTVAGDAGGSAQTETGDAAGGAGTGEIIQLDPHIVSETGYRFDRESAAVRDSTGSVQAPVGAARSKIGRRRGPLPGQRTQIEGCSRAALQMYTYHASQSE